MTQKAKNNYKLRSTVYKSLLIRLTSHIYLTYIHIHSFFRESLFLSFLLLWIVSIDFFLFWSGHKLGNCLFFLAISKEPYWDTIIGSWDAYYSRFTCLCNKEVDAKGGPKDSTSLPRKWTSTNPSLTKKFSGKQASSQATKLQKAGKQEE